MSIILVADDNSNIQKMVSLALEERGIQVVAVGNGEAAVRKIPEVRPDVVLADVFMPVRSGYEVCEFVKKDPRFAQTPVILLVGAFDPLDEKEARRVGADGVLKKPFVPPDPLIAMITSVLEKSAKPAPAPASAEQAAAPASQAVAPLPAPVPESQAEPEPEPEEVAASRGPLSLRDEDKSPSLEGLLGTAGTQSEDGNPWDEPESEWQRRRAQMDYDIPETGAQQEFDSHSDSHPATPPGAGFLGSDDLVTEEPRLSVEPGTLADLPGNPAEWMEMMSPSLLAEASKPAAPWQIAPQPPEPAKAETQDLHSATGDATSWEQFGDWQKGPPASEAQPEAAVPSETAEPGAQAPTEVPPETPAEALRTEPPTMPMWPASFEAEYGISAETVLGSESAGAWPPAESLKPTPGATGDLAHGELTSGVTLSGESQHAAGEPVDESTSKPEYELLVAPAAVIPFRQTESTPFPQQTDGPTGPRDLEAESAPKGSEVSSLYASYLPGDIASDVLHTAEEEGKAAPADLPATGAEPSPAPSSLDPALVDAVVAKVLERLRPELQEILSDKVVRPLVESALEHEIPKK